MLPMEPMAPLSLPEAPLPFVPAFALATLALLAPACDPEGEGVTGPLAAPGPVVDFGPVFEGCVLEHEWDLEVRSPLAIRESKTDCGCTVAQLERTGSAGRVAYTLEEPLAAGEHLIVRARYDTRGRRGPATRAVTLTTVDGAILPLTLQADIRPWLVTDPEELAFARVRERQTAERAFAVRALSDEPFRLTSTGRALAPWVTVEVHPRTPDGSGRARVWDARVKLGADAPQGTFSYPIELVSDVPVAGANAATGTATTASGTPRTYSISPSWTLQVTGAVALSAPTLEFGLVRADETVSRSVRLESFEPDFVPDAVHAYLQPAHPDEPFLLERTAQIHTRLVDHACEIEVTLAGLDPGLTGSFLAFLEVETGHPALPRLQALVRGVRAPEGAAQR